MRGGQMQPQLGIVKRFIRSLLGISPTHSTTSIHSHIDGGEHTRDPRHLILLAGHWGQACVCIHHEGQVWNELLPCLCGCLWSTSTGCANLVQEHMMTSSPCDDVIMYSCLVPYQLRCLHSMSLAVRFIVHFPKCSNGSLHGPYFPSLTRV